MLHPYSAVESISHHHASPRSTLFSCSLRSPCRLAWAIAALGLLFVGCSETTQSASIGAVLARNNDSQALYVRETPPGLAAEEAGLIPGDEIVMIDGVLAKKLTTEEVRKKLRGEPGTFVELTVARGPVILHVDVRRIALHSDDVEPETEEIKE